MILQTFPNPYLWTFVREEEEGTVWALHGHMCTLYAWQCSARVCLPFAECLFDKTFSDSYMSYTNEFDKTFQSLQLPWTVPCSDNMILPPLFCALTLLLLHLKFQSQYQAEMHTISALNTKRIEREKKTLADKHENVAWVARRGWVRPHHTQVIHFGKTFTELFGMKNGNLLRKCFTIMYGILCNGTRTGNNKNVTRTFPLSHTKYTHTHEHLIYATATCAHMTFVGWHN